MANKSKTASVTMPAIPELDAVVPAVQPEAPLADIGYTLETPEVETPEQVAERAKFVADELIREKNLIEALELMRELGKAQAEGADALTNAGIMATQLVWDRKVNESHVDAMYREFATGFNANAKGGERKDTVDKSAISRFKTFFLPEVAAFVYGTGANHNWHDTVADIRAGIETSNRKGSLYNALITFNREVKKAEKAATTKITVEHIEALLTRDAIEQKTVEARLTTLKAQINAALKKTGVDLSTLIEALDTAKGKLSSAQLKAIAE